MSARQNNTVEVQFTDGTYYRVEMFYAISAREFAIKLGRTAEAGKPWPMVSGVGLFKNYDKLVATFGNFDAELSK